MNIIDLFQIGASILVGIVMGYALIPCFYEIVYPKKNWKYWNFYFSKEEMEYYEKLEKDLNKNL